MSPTLTKKYGDVFCDQQTPLDLAQAHLEASRCYYCHDAPCLEACPTEIDIPSFIRKISTGNTKGAALDILNANIMGGTCARACPVEVLCQNACVRNTAEDKPVEIGLLQRFATDEFFAAGEQPFKREPATGKSVAVVGAGPAGLACAHRLARHGHDITIFELRSRAGGLNEYGLAPYKMTEFAQREVEFILSVGGITLKTGQALGRDFTLDELRKRFDAVFLSMGLQTTVRLGIAGEELPFVQDAVSFIERIRSTRDLRSISVGRDVVVIGGGNTAIDIAIEMKRLGAENVTLAYRRDESKMGATVVEREHARSEGVVIRTLVKPVRITEGEIEFEYTELAPDGTLIGTGKMLKLRADQIFKAIGQKFQSGVFQGSDASPVLDERTGKVRVTQNFETSIAGVFAGGDAVPGQDLTVSSVQHGKVAAEAIQTYLSAALSTRRSDV